MFNIDNLDEQGVMDKLNELYKIEKICWDLGDSELIYSLQPEKISSLLKQNFFVICNIT